MEDKIVLDLFNVVSFSEVISQFIVFAIVSIVSAGLLGISISKLINVMKG